MSTRDELRTFRQKAREHLDAMKEAAQESRGIEDQLRIATTAGAFALMGLERLSQILEDMSPAE